MITSRYKHALLGFILVSGCAAPKPDTTATATTATGTTTNKPTDAQAATIETGASVNVNGESSTSTSVSSSATPSPSSSGTATSPVSAATSVSTETGVAVSPTPAIVTTCSGYKLNGAGCWYASVTGQSCTDLCATHGGVEFFPINNTQCGELVKSVGRQNKATQSTNATYVPYGCYFWPVKGNYIYSNSSAQDNPNASSNAVTRLCNCAN